MKALRAPAGSPGRSRSTCWRRSSCPSWPASSAPTPLYAVYQSRWGFSPITTTVVFGVYALAVLAALLTVGSLSDHVGPAARAAGRHRSPGRGHGGVRTADGVPQLLIARIVQGLSTGAAVGAIGAGMLDLNKVRGTVANAVAPITGTATGALGSGLIVQFLPQPTHLVYLVLLGVLILQGLGVMLMPETTTPRRGRWRPSGHSSACRPRPVSNC